MIGYYGIFFGLNMIDILFLDIRMNPKIEFDIL